MGNIILNDQLDEPSSTQLKLVIDLNKPVSTQLTQLLHWSLQEIRNIYAPFRKRKSSPLLTRSQFLRLLRLSRISAFHIYDEICKTGNNDDISDMINAFELMAILILTAYTTYTYKIQCKMQITQSFFQSLIYYPSKSLSFQILYSCSNLQSEASHF